MKYHQRDVVEINFPIPGGGYKVHPAIIISNDGLQDVEGIFNEIVDKTIASIF